MAGNVAEWTADWYDEKSYSYQPNSNPKGASTGTQKVYRGGHFRANAMEIRKSTRMYALPATRSNTIGFRCAQDATN
jgi:formylglycine-generating enzyme required for sulfatase activity